MGVGWSSADAFIGRGVTFLVGLVLARILTPREYGLIGIVAIFTSVLSGFVDSGFSSALIRKKNASDEDYNTMFITNLGISVPLYLLLFLAAPWISRFFNEPQLVPLVRVLGCMLIIQSFSLVQYTILSRRVDFKTKTKASVISSVASGAVGIGMAFLGFGVWSIVAQQLSYSTIYTVCLWVFNRWWPKLKFDVASFRYMWDFGWKLLLSGLLDRIWKQIYQIVVGKFYNPATLGQYSRSKEYANFFSVNFTSIIQRVSYPVLSEMQDNTERMRNAYRKVLKDTMFVSSIVLIFMAAVAEPLMYCLIGPQWHQAATFLPLICVSMSLYPLHAINLNMLQVQGRSDLFLYLEILKKIIAVGPICLGIFVNIYWMLFGSIIGGIIAFLLNSYYSGRYIHYSSWMQVKDIAPAYGVALLIAVSVYFFKFLPFSYWIIFPIQILVGAFVLITVCEKIKSEEYLEIKGIIMHYLNRLKQIHR